MPEPTQIDFFVLVLSEAVLVLVLDGCSNLSELPLFDRIGRRGAIVQRPI